jgi:hypothetical protein
MENEIKIWQYQDAPVKYRFIYDDVDWVAFVPDSMYDVWQTISMKYAEVTSRRFDGGTVYIQTH